MEALRSLDRQPFEPRTLGQDMQVGEPRSNFSREGYLAAVEKAKDYIRAGDIFQVVPSQRWAMDFPCRPSRFTARSAGRTRLPSCSSSTSTVSRSWAPAPKSSCVCATAR
ncbi:chorismate-binding protein [Paracoccus cavernae]|uniref:Chorismate-binding protein n=1 Tax=Paracoccus cavernae TaxID=1571207 RepID=A0ABT8D5T1_9RHOB|nr:chorismate-binding protein [Paracoccus cavernae]